MKKYGKIIIAFMWLGLTMIMIVGATFAWFSENRNVEANGMQVQAETTKNLVISNASSADPDSSNPFVASSTLTSVTKLYPASTTNLTNFFTTTQETRQTKVDYNTGVAGTGATYVDITSTGIVTTDAGATDNNVDYVAKHSFFIKVDGETGATTKEKEE